MSFCTNCGNGLSQDDLFCQSCGSPVTKNETSQDVFQTPPVQQTFQTPPLHQVQQSYQSPPQQQYQPPPPQYYQQQPAKKKSILPIVLIILFVLFALGSVGGYFAYKYIVKKASDTVEKINTKVDKEITKEVPKENQQTKTGQNITETVKEKETAQENKKIDKSDVSKSSTETEKTTGGFPGKYPEGSKIYLDESDLIVYYGKEELKIMRNEIFARHGYIFKTDDLKSYFSKQSWYRAERDNVDNLLSNIEKKNIATIKSAEKRK
ncbi:MAG: YARHG domain-containing protein [Ignavibacteriota bacterium]